jgi:MFS family permease
MSTDTTTDVRRASAGQGAVLLAAACMPILGSTSIAPLQPQMAAAFPDQPGAEVLAGLILTVPALVIGLTALFAGRLIDRIGRKRVLVIALAAYAVVGTAPLWLPNLPAILVSRVGVGLAEAAIFSAAMATITDLFRGHRRARYFGLLNLVTGLAAVVFIALSGALGNENWRVPFWLYAIAAPLALVAGLVLRRDERRTERVALPPVEWRRLLAPILFTLVGGAVFYVPVAMLSFRLAELGVTQTAVIGAISAGAALALALAALSFPALLRRFPRVLLAGSFALLGIGLLVIGLAPSIALVAVGAVVANAGGGILLSTLQTWIVQGLPFAQRGRASGASTAGLFVGQFVAPLLVFAIAAGTGLGPAIAIVGVCGLVAAVVGAIVGRIRPDDGGAGES